MLKYVKTFRGSEIYQFILRKNLGHVDLALPPPPITSLRAAVRQTIYALIFNWKMAKLVKYIKSIYVCANVFATCTAALITFPK